jgi:hypothetical protein
MLVGWFGLDWVGLGIFVAGPGLTRDLAWLCVVSFFFVGLFFDSRRVKKNE